MTTPSAWEVRRLGDLLGVKHGFAFKGEDFSHEGRYIVVTPGNFVEGGGFKAKEGKEKYYSSEPPDEYVLNKGDLILALTDLKQDAPILGGPAWVPVDGEYLHNQRIGRVVGVDERLLHVGFAYYLFCTDSVRARIRATATGATVRHTAPKRIYELRVPLPPPPVQRRIASVLAAYDKLIENNARRIQILEEMAQAIYREWFVEFRYPGHEDVPLVDSPLGPIPEGWEVMAASSALSINPKVQADKEKVKAFVPMTSVSENSMHIDPIVERAGNAGARFLLRDTLFARITPCLENGKTAFVQFLPEGQVATGSTELIVLRGEELTPELVYLLARSEPFREHAIASMSGATGRQRVRSECFSTYRLPVSPSGLQDLFTKVVRPMFELSFRLFQAGSLLRATRDLLLPRLISGEIDVSELDIDVGDAAA